MNHMSIYLSNLSIYLFIYLSIYLFIYLSIYQNQTYIMIDRYKCCVKLGSEMLRYRLFWLASQSIFHFGYTPAISGILTREKLTPAPSQIWWFLDTECPKIIRIHFRRSKPSKLGSSHCKKKHLWGIPQPMPPPKTLASCSRCSITVSR